jgi:hypothetical protein
VLKVSIHKDFLIAYAKIPQSQQKKVREFITRFQVDPTASSINYEKIMARDPRVRTARIDRSYRAIVLHPGQGNVYVLVWVDNHDEAMDWAKNRLFPVNPITGSLQVIDTELVEKANTMFVEPQRVEEVKPAGLFDWIKDEELLLTGLPDVLLPSIRAISEQNQLFSLSAYLPEEAYEALTWIAEGFSVQEALTEVGLAKTPKLVDTADIETALENPTSQRRFVTLESADELTDMLNAPLEQWRVFLHPTQRAIVKRHFNGPARVLGGAGTGKTVVAMHRARYLAKEVFNQPNDRILFTTFTRNLARNIQQNMRTLCSREELDRIETTNLHAWAARFLSQQGLTFSIASSDEVDGCWANALVLNEGSFDTGFFRDEWENVIEANGISDLNQYLRIPRHGQKHRLSRAQRVQVWTVFEELRRQLDDIGKITFADLITQARLTIENNKLPPPYRAVIVDESQDLQPEELRLLRALVLPSANDLFFVGDGQQRIYKKPTVMSRYGIEIRGRSRRLKINYRTTEQIRNWSVGVLAGVPNDDLDGEIDRDKGYRSLRKGAPPKIELFQNQQAEIQFLVNQMMELVTGEANFEDICLVGRKVQLMHDYMTALTEAGITCYWLDRNSPEDEGEGIRVATMHRVKGLEFPHVYIVACNEGIIPAIGYVDGSDLDEFGEHLERCLIHVAGSRARDTLTITSFGEASRFLEV